MFLRANSLLGLFALAIVCPFAGAGDLPQPGKVIDYTPLAFFPQRWQEQKQSTQLFPWEGQQIVLLTTKNDLDPAMMAIFLERLDGGWKYYADMLGQAPRPGKLLNKKPTIAAVPDVRLTCGLGCGQVGATGIEVGGFDNDYRRVTKNAKVFPHYYFYEMGRNYFVFGDRHSSFTTGFAVFMRYCCMDKLACEDDEAALRKQIEQAEEHYSKTDISFLAAFTQQGGLGEKAPRLKNVNGPSDQPVLYASAMLKLRHDYGGDEWVGRFFRQLATCPEVKADKPEGALRQCVMWYVCASLAAKQDLAPMFVERWRLPLAMETRAALKEVRWDDQALTAGQVLKTLAANDTATKKILETEKLEDAKSSKLPAKKRVRVLSTADEPKPNTSQGLYIKILNDAGFDARAISAHEVREQKLEGIDIFVIGGGSGTAFNKSLSPDGGKVVQEFVRGGGGALASCAGGYSFVIGHNEALKYIEIAQARCLDFEHWARGAAEVTIAPADKRRAPFKMYYANGPLWKIEPDQGTDKTVALAHFVDDVKRQGDAGGIMPGTPAILGGTFGDGRFVLFSAHPEFHGKLGNTPLLVDAAQWVTRGKLKPEEKLEWAEVFPSFAKENGK